MYTPITTLHLCRCMDHTPIDWTWVAVSLCVGVYSTPIQLVLNGKCFELNWGYGITLKCWVQNRCLLGVSCKFQSLHLPEDTPEQNPQSEYSTYVATKGLAISYSRTWLMETCSVDCESLEGSTSVNLSSLVWLVWSSVGQAELANSHEWLIRWELALVPPRCAVMPCSPVLFCQYDWGTPIGSLIVSNIKTHGIGGIRDLYAVIESWVLSVHDLARALSICPSYFCSLTCLAWTHLVRSCLGQRQGVFPIPHDRTNGRESCHQLILVPIFGFPNTVQSVWP